METLTSQQVVPDGTECACFVGIASQVGNTCLFDQIVPSDTGCAFVGRSVSAVFAWKSALIHAFVVHNSQPWPAFGTVASSAGFAVVRTSFAGGQDIVLVINRFKTIFAPVALVNFVVFTERASCDALDALLGSRMVNVTNLASVTQRIGIGRRSSADVTVVDAGSASAGCDSSDSSSDDVKSDFAGGTGR